MKRATVSAAMVQLEDCRKECERLNGLLEVANVALANATAKTPWTWAT